MNSFDNLSDINSFSNDLILPTSNELVSENESVNDSLASQQTMQLLTPVSSIGPSLSESNSIDIDSLNRLEMLIRQRQQTLR